jgi:hypothetical protein
MDSEESMLLASQATIQKKLQLLQVARSLKAAKADERFNNCKLVIPMLNELRMNWKSY